MKKHLLLFIIILKSYLLSAQPSIQWQKSLGGSGRDFAPTIEKTLDGGYIIAGITESNDSDVTGYRGNADYWIVKINNSGSIEWKKTLGGTDKDYPYSIQQTSDEGYIVAGYSISDDIDITGNHGQEDYWIAKLNNAGVLEWQKSLGGSNNDIAYSIQQTSSGGYIVAGSTKSTDGDITFHHGSISIQNDFWIVNLDSTGGIIWEKSLGGGSSDIAYSVKQTTDGGFIVAGNSNSTDGDVTGNHGTSGNSDFWIVKLNSSGIIQWQKALGGDLGDFAASIQQTSDGGYIVAGNSFSSNGDVTLHYGSFVDYDYWIVKLDSTGILMWQKTFGGTSTDMATSIRQTTDGGYIVAGYTNSDDWDLMGLHGITFDYDYWILKLSDSGVIQWQKVLGGTKDDVAFSVQETSDNGFIVSGNSRSNNRDVTGNNGESDFWIVKLSPLTGVNEIQTSILDFQISPNPFSIQTFISFQHLVSKNVEIEIHDLEGRIIKKFNADKNEILWDATNNWGSRVEDGIYFITVVTENII